MRRESIAFNMVNTGFELMNLQAKSEEDKLRILKKQAEYNRDVRKVLEG